MFQCRHAAVDTAAMCGTKYNIPTYMTGEKIEEQLGQVNTGQDRTGQGGYVMFLSFFVERDGVSIFLTTPVKKKFKLGSTVHHYQTTS